MTTNEDLLFITVIDSPKSSSGVHARDLIQNNWSLGKLANLRVDGIRFEKKEKHYFIG